ncbi:hypothetical protein SAMN04489860_2522 [Paraoerskovia marina]|uniref:Tetracyclin repressor-like C-terminal group 31 domain-containing protein n=1 Tax=Paraoerskovia marina TaxID=545619 RepID=A0A1H1VL41_9CELL|nr:hypothetical protein [Paraoerskovia marina]SDS84749.1 hypothetical protein SAMN04489860_2522 [Paraoerskovia marina]
MPTQNTPRRQARGRRRHDAIVRAAADIMLSEGAAAVTHRHVAAVADVPLAATTYYFSGITDLLAAAGALIVDGWGAHVEEQVEVARAAETAGGLDGPEADLRRAEILTDAILPAGDRNAVRGFYEHLVGAGRVPELAQAYADGRVVLDDALAELFTVLGLADRSHLLVAIVDGAAVSALAEGRDARELAVRLIQQVLAP